MRRVAGDFDHTARLGCFADPQLRVFSHPIFNVFDDFSRCRQAGSLRTARKMRALLTVAANSRHQFVHGMKTGERITRIKQSAFVKRLQIVFDIAPRQRRPAQNNRDVNVPFVHHFEVLFHDER